MNQCYYGTGVLPPLWVYKDMSTEDFIAELDYDLMLAEYGVSNVEAEPDGTLTRKVRR